MLTKYWRLSSNFGRRYILSFQMVWEDDVVSVHYNMKNHTRSVMTLRKDTVYSFFTKQKLNTKSQHRIETSWTWHYNNATKIGWTQHFWIAQGNLKITEHIVYHHDQIIIRDLRKMRRGSSGKCTCHIKIFVIFFVTALY